MDVTTHLTKIKRIADYSVDTQKASDKMQHPFVIKKLLEN